MIVRTGRRIPGIAPLGGVHAPISVVRMAVGDAYGAKEWREGDGEDEVGVPHGADRAADLPLGRRVRVPVGRAHRRGVFGGPKYTVSPVYEGMLKEEMDAAAARHPEVTYQPQLIDATFALLLSASGDPLVIPALNRDGDILSDLVLPLFGSIAGSESLHRRASATTTCPTVVLAEAAHGTAPALQGKNVANPMAMILAGAALLSYGRRRAAPRARSASRASRRWRTASAPPTSAATRRRREFTDEVIRRVRQKLEVWSDALARRHGPSRACRRPGLVRFRPWPARARTRRVRERPVAPGFGEDPHDVGIELRPGATLELRNRELLRSSRGGTAGRSSSRRTRRPLPARVPRAGSPRPRCLVG